MTNDARIAALEEQVARLSAMLERRAPGAAADGDQPVDRRTLLRRSGAVLAGLAGAAAVPTVLAGPASAATGDPVLAGATNTANAGDVTVLQAPNPDEPVLELRNTATVAPFPDDIAHPQLRLLPSAGIADSTEGDAGDIMAADFVTDPGGGGSFLYYAHAGAATGDPVTFWGNVYTSQYANFAEFLSAPQRVLDTRFGTGVTTAGKRSAGSTTVVDLDDLVLFGIGVIGNLTVVAPDSAGYLTAFPGDAARPNASSLNYVKGQTIANFAMVGLGPSGGSQNALKIYTSARADILFDVTGFLVPDIGFIVSGAPADASNAERSARSPRQRSRR